MNRLKHLLPLILIVLALLLSAAKGARPLQQSRNQSDAAKTNKDAPATQEQQAISPAYVAAILETLRAEVQEEVAKREQDHADHKDWNTKPFWLMFGLNAALVAVGTVYTIFAYCQWRVIREQAEISRIAMRAQRLAAIAAKESAEATRLMLNAQRAYVSAVNFRMETRDTQKQQYIPVLFEIEIVNIRERWIWFELRSSNGVAVVEAIHLKAAIVRRSGNGVQWESTKTQRLPISQRVISVGETTRQGTSSQTLLPLLLSMVHLNISGYSVL